MEQRSVAERVVVLLLIVAGIVGANVLAFTFGAGDTGDVANEAFGETNYFFPASYVFATIWPVIYLGLGALAVHQLLNSQRTNSRYKAGLTWLGVSVLLNTGWIAIFDSQLFVWAFWAILPIVALAAVAHKRLSIGERTDASRVERIVRIGVSIYTAWVTVATIAAAASALLTVGWQGFGVAAETWGVIMIVVGGVLGVAFLFLFGDPVFPAVYAYAYVGIAVRWLSSSSAVGVTALVAAGLLFIAFVLGVTLRNRIKTSRAA